MAYRHHRVARVLGQSGQPVTATASRLTAMYSTRMTPAMLAATPIPTATARPRPEYAWATVIPGIAVLVKPGTVVAVKAVNARGMEGWDWVRVTVGQK